MINYDGSFKIRGWMFVDPEDLFALFAEMLDRVWVERKRRNGGEISPSEQFCFYTLQLLVNNDGMSDIEAVKNTRNHPHATTSVSIAEFRKWLPEAIAELGRIARRG